MWYEALKKIDENSDLSEDHIALSNMAIIRLQRFYGIPASDMAEGRYNDRIIGDPMNGKFNLYHRQIVL